MPTRDDHHGMPDNQSARQQRCEEFEDLSARRRSRRFERAAKRMASFDLQTALTMGQTTFVVDRCM